MHRLTRLAILGVWLGGFSGGCAHAPEKCADPTPAPETGATDPTPAPTTPLVETHPQMVLEGTPPIPPAFAARFQPYLDTRVTALASVADDGRSILVLTRLGAVKGVQRVAEPLGKPTQVTFEAEPILAAGFWPGSSDTIVELRDVGGNEQYQAHRRELQTGAVTPLTPAKSRTEGLAISYDGTQLAFGSNVRNGKDFDIWIGDGKSLANNQIAVHGHGQWTPRVFSRDGKSLVLQEYVSIADSRLYLLDLASKEVTRVSPEAPVAAYRSALFDRDGTRLFVLSDRGGERLELYVYDLARRTWTNWSGHIPWNVEDLALSPDGETLAVLINEDGYGVVRLFDTARGKELAPPALPRGLITGLRYARTASVLGFSLASATDPGGAYTYDLDTQKLTRWTASDFGGVDPASLVDATLIHYKAFDGRLIPAFAYVPTGPGPFPVVIDIHGGPEGQARPGFSASVQAYVHELGVALIVPNVRGSDGYGRGYLALDDGFRREDAVKDIGSLLDWIDGDRRFDGKRVAVTGGSYGGFMVLASLVRFGARLRAGIDLCGISNFLTFLANTAEYRRDLRRVEYGDERDPAMHAFLAQISPTAHADAIKSALFVAQGANDPRVPPGEATQIAAAVKQAGSEVWSMLALNEGHGFAKKENREMFTLLAAMFLEKQLGLPGGAPRDVPGTRGGKP